MDIFMCKYSVCTHAWVIIHIGLCVYEFVCICTCVYVCICMCIYYVYDCVCMSVGCA